jgi:amino acid adenylation domain-containing protein
VTGSPSSSCLLDALETCARTSPRATAVVCEGRQLTYGALNRRANQLARCLRRLGVGPDVLVGICLDRSPDLVVALLATLKAGGAYLPLDPAFPLERLGLILADACPRAVLTQERLLASLPRHKARVICLDRDRAVIAREGADAVDGGAGPGNLAYVLYTSGSTGKPKGVEVTRAALGNFLASMRRRPGLTEQDRVLAVTTISFDIAGLELWLPLVVGGSVEVATREVATDGARLAQRLAASGATVLQATPATWRLLLNAGWKGGTNLTLLCGGEAMPRQLANELLPRGAALWNMYGPTETTIWSLIQPVAPGGGPVPIGLPIDNTQVYLLGPGLRPVPDGEAGELCIGGLGLARGYRNRPALTADRFIPNPFGGEPGARLYRTGDLARRLPDGTFECLGRVDHQVKVRGFRIELGEVEAALERHAAVREAVVVAREESPGEKRLVAYVVARDGEPAAADLRRFLRAKLPDYMVPSAFFPLPRFPLTPNGKVDRLALPAPDALQARQESAYVAPRDALECEVAAIWERVLNVRPVGARDDIFDLGVHSLTAAQIFAETEKRFRIKLPPGLLFQAPTVEQLVEEIRNLQSEIRSNPETRSVRPEPPPGVPASGMAGSERGVASDFGIRISGLRWTSLVTIQPHGSRPPLFCVHGGAGTVLFFHELARRLGPDQPLYGLQSQGLYGGDPPHYSVEDMAAHYLSEVRSRQPAGPYFLSGYCFGGLVAFEMARRLRAAGEEVALLALFNAPGPAYLRRPPQRPAWLTLPRPAGGLRATFVWLLRRARRSLAWRLRCLRRPFWVAFWRARCRRYCRLGRPVPEAIRARFWPILHALAERAYAPPAYPGSMMLFREAGLYDDPSLGWSGLAAGGIEVHEIGDAHADRRTWTSEPYLRAVAERLAATISSRLSALCPPPLLRRSSAGPGAGSLPAGGGPPRAAREESAWNG